MESIWRKTTDSKKQDVLKGDMSTEVAVIGGGLAGILTAHFLQKQGIKTIVLEANQIGSGQTGNSTAKITSQHALLYENLIRTSGEAQAFQYACANQKAILQYRNIIEENQIACQFEECSAYLYSTEEEDILRREVTAASKLGIHAEFTKDTELPFAIKGAVKFYGQAQFHPLQFIQALAEELTIYEHTKVKEVEDNLIKTEVGTVTAKKIVFATHYPFVNIPGYYFMRMHQERTYLLALEDAMLPTGIYRGIDKNGLSMRRSGNCLLLGGGSHRTGENSAGGKYQFLRNAAAEYWPESHEVAHWSAQDCMTLDGIPYIGQFSATTPDWYVATGFGKWGMSNAMVSAVILSDLIAGADNQNARVFSPKRFDLTASAKNLMEDGKQTVKGFTKRILPPTATELEQIPNGQGGIIEYEGEKVGVYKNEEGEIFMVSVKCPHLGCQLEWNPDERSWDCPCHGSRFDYMGQILDNPAQENLQSIE